MRLKVSHRTEYSYDEPIRYGLQRLRLWPASGPAQTMLTWALHIEGAREEVRFLDQFGNDTRLLSIDGDPHTISVVAEGEIETNDTAGVSGPHRGFAPLWLFEHQTPLTAPGTAIRDLAASVGDGGDLQRLHGLMALIQQRIAYVTGTTDSRTTAEEALVKGTGVCQDHSHVFAASARLLGFPARYVSGYLMMNDRVDQVATHAWAEAYVSDLGWVGFDAANGMSPDERYVRVAVGRDYREAMPIAGILIGHAQERLAVHITVEQ
ncbi:transglutaminase family protein [Aminobacter sp. NyZ550]|uniref:Transglutaminase n=2 Tax=Aminobacter TaxID=31988 RepID=A0A142M8G7_AMIAI|nr:MULTISPECIES: transglutaminase family protein [Aminobacter]AMS42637.1 transglutaminase [Aminobacter aminovorans]MBB3709420.1 transglutaminase-like putative cysteine protease [Aminobacter aminovorans]MRX36800.1 transglutaminase family protein [Aminobacter sp. MDW-2]QNH32706.1 transglutaminase family protein [Aminobacter sp. MDW-2]TCS27737.1 transglutaminase-like putative cysteine protease [Aminobacter aminovorans]